MVRSGLQSAAVPNPPWSSPVPDKNLSEREWKAFNRNANIKADAFQKALAALDKAEKSPPADQLQALDEVEKQATALRHANKADKALAGYLAELDKSAKALRKQVLAQQARQKDEEPDEDAVTKALLDPKKLLDQLNQCRRDPNRRVNFGFIEASKEDPAVLAMSPRTGAARLYALLRDATGRKSGAYGTAWVDDKSLMLQLDKPLGGLVKKIRGPVRDCGFRIAKAVLWNPDGSVFEQEESEDETDEASGQQPKGNEGGQRSAADAELFKKRLTALLPGIKTALTGPGGAAIKRLVDAASEQAKQGDFRRALASLDDLDKQLAASKAVASKPSTGDAASKGVTTDDAANAFKARLAALVPQVQALKNSGQAGAQDVALKVSEAGGAARKQDYAAANRLLDAAEALMKAGGSARPAIKTLPLWTEAQDAVGDQINSLRTSLKATRHPMALEIADKGLSALTDRMQVGLKVALMELDGSSAPQDRAKAAAKARQSVDALRQFVQTNKALQRLDGNPFGVKVAIRATLRRAIDALDKALAA